MIIKKTQTDPRPFQGSTWEQLLQTARRKTTWRDGSHRRFSLESLLHSVGFPFRISVLWCKMKIKALGLWYRAKLTAGKIQIRTSSVNRKGKIYQAVSESLGDIQRRLLLVWEKLAIKCDEIENVWVRKKCSNAISNGVDTTLNLHRNTVNRLNSFLVKSNKNRHYDRR